MRYGSVCSGIEAATQAWHPLGWRPSFFSEIEQFPRAVLKHHYPDVPLHGDFTTIEDQYEPIELLVGGTPCQSFSIAGLRGGMDDDCGNLALEYVKLAERLRPRWLVWENVPGVLSSNGGRDFGSLLGALGHIGYGWAYRVLDAQHVRTRRFRRAVPQRRRRVFLVGYLGDWRRAAAVLFDRQSLSGDIAPRRQTGKAAATIPSRSIAGGGWPADVACTLNAAYSDKMGLEDQHALSGASLFVIQEAATRENPASDMAVRRLLPIETERLQGFPDDFTRIPYRGKPADQCPDGPRYKSLGNSMAVNCMEWIGERIEMVEGIENG